MFQFLVDPWINRRKKADPTAVAAVEGKTPAVVITGGSSGIGLAIAARFARSGRAVALVARDKAGLAEAAEKILKVSGQSPNCIACDITEPTAGQHIDAQLEGHGCYLDVLVNSAGAGVGGDFISRDAGEIENVIDVNVQALTRLNRHVLPEMLARGRGGIINVSSLGGMLPGPYQAVYYASKSYVISFTRALASEASGRGVRISCVLPGPVRTNFHDALDGSKRALYRYLLPWLSPERVAGSTYRGFLLGHKMIVPGVFNAALYVIVGLLPYALTVPLVGMLLYPGPNGKSR